MYCENKKEALDFIKRMDDEDFFPCILDRWTVADVLEATADPDTDEERLTAEQAAEVLGIVNKRYDAERGINWDRIESVARELFPKDMNE